MTRIQESLSGHVVIAGFGKNGSTAAAELLRAGVQPHLLVAIDCADGPCAAARDMGAAVIQGDASRDELLKAVRIEAAERMIVSAGRDDTSILIVLSARKLAPHLPIAVTIREADNEDIAENAGATRVINPVAVTGRMLAEKV